MNNNLLRTLLRVVVIQSVLILISSNNLKEIQTFSESVQYKDKSIRATRICARFDRPVYLDGPDRLRQIHRVNDVLLDNIAVVRCSSNISHHNLILYPITQNVSRSIVSLFRGLKEKCPRGTVVFAGNVTLIMLSYIMRSNRMSSKNNHSNKGTQYQALTFHSVQSEETCRLVFESNNLVDSKREIVRGEAPFPRPLDSMHQEVFLYEYEPEQSCNVREENQITTLVELDSMASEHGLLTATQALKVGIFKIIFDPVRCVWTLLIECA